MDYRGDISMVPYTIISYVNLQAGFHCKGIYSGDFKQILPITEARADVQSQRSFSRSLTLLSGFEGYIDRKLL
jgi:hypothetical protein